MSSLPVNPPDLPADTIERVIRVVAESRGLERSAVRLDSTLQELGFDSLDGLNLFFEIEEEFEVSIPDEVARKITTVRQIVEQLAEHLADPSRKESPA